jgi:hypothetical protein
MVSKWVTMEGTIPTSMLRKFEILLYSCLEVSLYNETCDNMLTSLAESHRLKTKPDAAQVLPIL